jgi:hypothetical protein
MHRRSIIGSIAISAAFLGFLSVLVGPSVVDAMYPKPPLEERVADKVVAMRDSIKSRLKGEPRPAPSIQQRFDKDELPYSISLALAGIGVIGGCVGYLRREDHRFAYIACGVGAVTLVWHALLLALGAVAFCLIVFAVISWLGGG